ERAVARERDRPVGAADADEAVALDGDVERAAGLELRARLEAATDDLRGGAAAGDDAGPGAHAGLLVDEIAEADAQAVVAGCRDVRDVIRDRVQPRLLGHEPRSGGMQPYEHRSPSHTGPRPPLCGPADVAPSSSLSPQVIDGEGGDLR